MTNKTLIPINASFSAPSPRGRRGKNEFSLDSPLPLGEGAGYCVGGVRVLILILGFWLLLLGFPAQAEEYLLDVPAGYWASDSVYDLVKMGVTKGFPDGTFRGKKKLTRYEAAALLSKFATAVNLQQGADEKILHELKSEIAGLGYEQKKSKEQNLLAGYFIASQRVTPTSPRGGKADYRLKLALLKRFSVRSVLKLNFDTLDLGFASPNQRNISRDLLDIEGQVRLGAFDLIMNYGPGWLIHTGEADGFSSYNYTVFPQPRPSVKVLGQAGKLSFLAEYDVRQAKNDGTVNISELTGKLGFDSWLLSLNFQPRYLFGLTDRRQVLADLGLTFSPNSFWQTDLFLSAGSFRLGPSAYYAKVKQYFRSQSTSLLLRFDKVGSLYRRANFDQYEFIDLNNFNRYILDGKVDLGLSLKQDLSSGLSLELKGDYVMTGAYKYGLDYPGTYLLWQAGLGLDLNQQFGLAAFYRSYHVPSGLDQFGQTVPTLSAVVGANITCTF